jgi:hypothetical protein
LKRATCYIPRKRMSRHIHFGRPDPHPIYTKRV